MGAKCCGDGRKKGPSNVSSSATNDPKGPALARPSTKERKSLYAGNTYSSNPQKAKSISYSSEGGDDEKFDRAFEATDLKMFVELLASQQPLESLEEQMHPWAQNPRTIGTLAATQLATLCQNDDTAMKGRIREAGGIQPLVDFLRSDQEDRVHTAVVALNFLTTDCPDNAIAAYKSGAMQLLMKHLDSSIVGMRTDVATILRNICLQDNAYRKEFVTLGGIVGLVGQLSTTADPGLNLADIQIDAMLNLADLIENEDGGVIEEYARDAINAGAETKLQVLARSDDEEVRSTADEILAKLAEAQR